MHHGIMWLGGLLGLGLVGFLAYIIFGGVVSTLMLAVLVVVLGGAAVLITRGFMRLAAHTPYSLGNERFAGQHAIVTVTLAPVGRVRFHGEDWSARIDEAFANQPIPVGASVRIEAVQELTLIVTPAESELLNHARRHLLADSSAM